VVVSGELLFVDSTKINPSPQEKDYVTFKREFRSVKLNGTFSIVFVRQERLLTFVSECLEPLIKLTIELTTNRADFVLKREVPWEDND
jgi:hypothetical protein